MILDGWGIGKQDSTDAIASTPTPFISSLYGKYPNSQLLTCGENVQILTYNSTSTRGSELEYLANAEWANNEYVYTPITEKGTYSLDLSQIVVDYAAEDYIDEWGYPNKKWHGKAHRLEGSCAWTIGEGTSIENIEAENSIKVIYDLTGRRVENVTNAGIYIVNGKKVIVK